MSGRLERAELCREDSTKVSRSWGQLLAPYFKRQQPPGAFTS